MGEEAKSSIIEADMIRKVIIFTVPDSVCFFCLTVLWIHSDKAGQGIREGRQALMVCEVGVWEDGILRQLRKIHP